MDIDIFSRPEVFWFILGIVFFVCEIVMTGFFIFFFGIGACVTAIACLIGNPGINLQIIIFLTVSVLSLLAFRKMLRKAFFAADHEKSQNIENEFTGKDAVAITDFDDNYMGKIEFKGATWKAEANAPVKTNQIVKIINKEGLTLKVELKNE
jgi:membrane protein implicated in regulation of membrane protease activity